VAGIEVELVLRIVRPLGEQTAATGEKQPERQCDQDDRLDDPLDDDDFDKGVVLAAHAAELGPEAGEVMRPFSRWGRGHSRDLNKLGWMGD